MESLGLKLAGVGALGNGSSAPWLSSCTAMLDALIAAYGKFRRSVGLAQCLRMHGMNVIRCLFDTYRLLRLES